MEGREPTETARQGNFFGCPRACHRQRGRDAFGAIGVPAGGVNVGIDDAGAHAVDADAFARDFKRETDGEGIDRAFRRRVVGIDAGGAELGGSRT